MSCPEATGPDLKVKLRISKNRHDADAWRLPSYASMQPSLKGETTEEGNKMWRKRA